MSQSNASLYERLGRHEGITRITRELMKNHLSNPLIKTRFLASENLERVERRAVEFLCAGSGGPESYTGKDLLTTHKGMNISEQELCSVIDDALDALDKCGVEASARNEVLAILWSLKGDVVRV